MGHPGFSYIGLLWLLMLAVPNFLWARHQPQGYIARNENRLLVILERTGQVCVTGAALLFADTNPTAFTSWTCWLLASLLLMLLYLAWWIRYFRGSRRLAAFYSSFCGLPLAGATLPVLAFLLLGIYGRLIWLVLGTLLLGVGHIGIHLRHAREIGAGPFSGSRQ